MVKVENFVEKLPNWLMGVGGAAASLIIALTILSDANQSFARRVFFPGSGAPDFTIIAGNCLLASLFLVAFNTLSFLFDAFGAALVWGGMHGQRQGPGEVPPVVHRNRPVNSKKRAKENNPKPMRSMGKVARDLNQSGGILLLMAFAVSIITAGGASVILILCLLRGDLIIATIESSSVHSIDVVAIIVFVLFAIIDVLFWGSARRQKDGIRAVKYLSQLMLVDIPVLAGTVVLWAVGSKVSYEVGWSSFLCGFSAGGVAMHVIYSQIVFIVIAVIDWPKLAK